MRPTFEQSQKFPPTGRVPVVIRRDTAKANETPHFPMFRFNVRWVLTFNLARGKSLLACS